VSLKPVGHTTGFPAVFEAIERLLREGDLFVQELAVTGYLEGFQMETVATAGPDPERDFRPYLLPKSEEAWISVNEFWARNESWERSKLAGPSD
jgi:hypothetical protein